MLVFLGENLSLLLSAKFFEFRKLIFRFRKLLMLLWTPQLRETPFLRVLSDTLNKVENLLASVV